MRLPEIAATSPARAWIGGVSGAAVLIGTTLGGPFAVAYFGLPIAAALLAAYSLTVRPRAFAASGVLFGALPWLTWGVIDGLLKCVGVGRGGGFCEADPSAQVGLALGAYVATAVMTAIALWHLPRDG